MAVPEKPSNGVETNEEDGPNATCRSKAAGFLKKITVEPLLGMFMLSTVLSNVTTLNLNLQKSCRANLKIDDFVCEALERKNVTGFNATLSGRSGVGGLDGGGHATVLDAMRFNATRFAATCFNATAAQGGAADRVTAVTGLSTQSDASAILGCFEKEVQALVIDMSVWQSVIQNAIPCALVVFAGSWSDRNKKRKVFMLLPIFGELVRNAGLIACVYFFREWPMEVAGIVESVPSSVAGYLPVLFLAVFAYVGDITTVENRTLRVGVVCLVSSLSFPIGAALSGVLYQAVGYYGIYGIATTLFLFSFIYGILVINDSKLELDENNKELSVEVLQSQDVNVIDKILDFFSLKHAKEAFRVTFNHGDENRRTTIIMLLVIIFILTGPIMGEQQTTYLLTRIRYDWDEVKFSFYLSLNSICNLLGIGFTLCVLVNQYKLDDRLIGALGCLSKGLAAFVYAFAPNEYVFYLAPVIDIFHGAGLVAIRSILSKLVPASELGQVLAVFSLAEAMVPAIFKPLYSKMYKITYETFPGFFFIFGGTLVLPGVVMFLWMFKKQKKIYVLVEGKQTFADEVNFMLKNNQKIR